jgi:hypothetical protein
MRAEVSDWYTEIYPTPEEVTEHCKPGTEGACVWLVVGSEGFECTYMHKPLELLDRWKKV